MFKLRDVVMSSEKYENEYGFFIGKIFGICSTSYDIRLEDRSLLTIKRDKAEEYLIKINKKQEEAE